MVNFTNQEDVITFLEKLCYNSSIKSSSEDGRCDTSFDGYLCWPSTKAGELAVQNCSGEFLKSSANGIASRQCTENGSWYFPPDGSFPYSNITECGTLFITVDVLPSNNVQFYQEWIPKIKEISYCGYTLSIISLILSICVFVSIKRLHCSRNKLHINLFFSCILRSLMAILKDALFVKGTALPSDTIYHRNGHTEFSLDHNYSWVCKAIMSFRYYCIISNFMFMLMEGMYLHNLMFLKLFSDHRSVTPYCLLGWGLPIIFIVPWIIIRILYENVMCWTRKENTYIALFIDLPIGITVVINFILFLIIVRVLTLKLNSVCIQQRKFKYRKLLKATLILIPLFGVPYLFSLLMSIYVVQSKILEIVYLFFDQSFAAFQGLFAALVYCFLNSEVQIEIKRKYSLIKDRNNQEFRRSRTISNTQQVSLNITEDVPENENICMSNGKQKRNDVLVEREQQFTF